MSKDGRVAVFADSGGNYINVHRYDDAQRKFTRVIQFYRGNVSVQGAKLHLADDSEPNCYFLTMTNTTRSTINVFYVSLSESKQQPIFQNTLSYGGWPKFCIQFDTKTDKVNKRAFVISRRLCILVGNKLVCGELMPPQTLNNVTT